MKNMWLPARQPPRCAKEQRPATQYAARGRRTDAFAQRFRTLLSDASKLVLDVLPVPLELPCEGGLAYPIQVVDAPLQLVERELGGGSVSLGFLRTVANALVACVHGVPSLLHRFSLGAECPRSHRLTPLARGLLQCTPAGSQGSVQVLGLIVIASLLA
jgi:hypothetical protein